MKACSTLLFALIALAIFAGTHSSRAVLLWSDLGSTQVHETGAGADILGGILQRNDSSADTLYFKFHVDPLSDATTEEYFAAFQLFEGNQERLALGNALRAWAYSAFATGEKGASNQMIEYIDLNSANPERPGLGASTTYELPHWGIERTIVFKVQYVPGGDDLVTVWLNPILLSGATEANQPGSVTTHFKANAAFDQIRLRHGGGGAGWIFSEMAIATSFNDFVTANESETGAETPFTFRSWQREQGLPENFVRALAQTRNGYIWVGSDEGVSWFDGVNFSSLGLREGFQSGPVRVLYGDSQGALWIGSVDAGLSCWQGGKLRKFTTHDGLPSDSITALAEDGDGRLWVGTQTGLVFLQNGRFTPLPGAEMFSGKPIVVLVRDHKGSMWIGAEGAGIFSCQKNKFVQLQDPSLGAQLREPHCLVVDQKGRIWIGAGDAFVFCRDGDQWLRFGMPRHVGTPYVTSLVEGRDETVWAGSKGEGLFEFKAGKLAAINASSGLSDNMIETLLMDREGKLWVGTHGGLNRIYSRKVSVLNHNDGLDYGGIQGLVEMGHGLVWAAQPNGVYEWSGHMFRRLIFAGLPPQTRLGSSLLAAQDGSCWVTAESGMLHFKNPQTAESETVQLALPNVSISALAQNAKNGEVWAGARNGELWSFLNGKWQPQTNFPCCHPITGIIADAGDAIWAGTDGEGLYRLHRGTHFQLEKVRGLPSASIRTLHLDTQGTLWIGTAGGGLCRLQNGQLAAFTAREGLPDNTISQILEDDAGNLWLGGNRGIARVKKHDLDDLATHTIPAVYPQIYGRADGLSSEECTSGFFPTGLKTKTGPLWFSTLKGIAVIDPRHILESPAPTVTIEQTLVDGVPASPESGAPDVSTKKADGSIESLRLAPGKHAIEFRYTGLSFDAPERVRFRFRLEPLDPNWLEAGTRRVALYSFVPPGTYRFRVIACNGDGVWNEKGASLGLTVLPHFWQTWWFLGSSAFAMVMVSVVGGRFVVRRRLQQRLKRLEQDRTLERERTRIAQDLHDIMGAKLCRISFMSEHVRRSQTIPAELQEQIRSMSDDSREVLQSLDEIVWAVNPEKDTLEHLVFYLVQYAREYFRRTGIECETVIPAQLPAQPLTSQFRHHLFLAVHEALTNILKHSEARQARIAIACGGNTVEITVSDNGKGFDPASNGSASSAAGFGNGLGNMRRRMSELGGQCSLESRPGQGVTIRFVLRLKGSVI
jgi:ligand-binding sensor domain-containing protein/signal transduction histidine kinase